jgi:hypothetical protein
LEIPESVFYPLYFNDFDVRLACPLGRLGASRPPAAEVGIPEEAILRGNLRNSSLRCQGAVVLPRIRIVGTRDWTRTAEVRIPVNTPQLSVAMRKYPLVAN